MKISRNWLQAFFDTPLPDATALSDALTFHVFEIDGIEKHKTEKSDFSVDGEDDILDVKVTANRGHDCLSYWGIAKEISAILNIPLNASGHPKPYDPKEIQEVSVSIDSPLCNRFIAGLIHGVKVGPSPAWLVERLEAMGQRSINNVVDASNYVMFNLGQPSHAFDAGKITQKDGKWMIQVRTAKPDEKILALDEKEYTLNDSMIVIADAHTDAAIGIAGVKGGTPASITESTTDIIIECANFNGVSVRKTAQALKLRSDASARFEQGLAPELAAYGMRAVVDLIVKVAGGEIVGFTDMYPTKQEIRPVSVTLEKVNKTLGTTLAVADISDVFTRLGLTFELKGATFLVTPPFERLDLIIPEDLIEEIGRSIGYDKVSAVELPPFTGSIEINKNFYWSEKIRESLISQGFYEVFTSVFSKEVGTRMIANKIDGIRPYLRQSLTPGITEAFKKNLSQMDFLGLQEIKMFEIGYVWTQNKSERLAFICIRGGNGKVGDYESLRDRIKDQITTLLATATAKGITIETTTLQGTHKFAIAYGLLPENEDDYTQLSTSYYDDLPTSSATRYAPFSRYPYIVRDIAFWTTLDHIQKIQSDALYFSEIFKNEAGELLLKSTLFDKFEKGEKTSLAFRLIFQSFERTLTDEEINPLMQKVSTALTEKGFEIR